MIRGDVERARRFGMMVVVLVNAFACASVESPQTRDARLTTAPVAPGRAVSQLELQQSIQRFTGEFLDGVTESYEASKADDPKLQVAGMRRVLIYGSSALDIASGPQPELNVLDMLVFVTLSRETLEAHWLPRVFGAKGQPLVQVFTRSEQSLWEIADRIMSAQQQQQLRDLITTWRSAHAEQVRVEWVRFRDFSVGVEGVARERAAAARGLLGAVRAASQTADQAVMLGERAMFVAHRLPFVLRLQARLGVHESLDDSLQLLEESGAVQSNVDKLNGLVAESVALTRSVEAATREGRLFYREVEPLLRSLRILSEPGEVKPDSAVEFADFLELLESSNRLAAQSSSLLHELRSLTETADTGQPRPIGAAVEHLLQRCLLYLGLLGAAWALFFWGGYYIAKLAVARKQRRASEPEPRPPEA